MLVAREPDRLSVRTLKAAMMLNASRLAAILHARHPPPDDHLTRDDFIDALARLAMVHDEDDDRTAIEVRNILYLAARA